MNNLIQALEELQSKTIGLLKNRFSSNIELVIEVNDDTIVTTSIGGLGGLRTDHYPADKINDYGKFEKFPDNKTLTQMKEDIFKFNDFIQEFGK